MLIKLHALKEGLHSLFIEGKEYIVNKDKIIEVNNEHVDIAISHGFELFNINSNIEIDNSITEIKNKTIINKKGKK